MTFDIRTTGISRCIARLPTNTGLTLVIRGINTSTPTVSCRDRRVTLPTDARGIVATLTTLVRLNPSFHFAAALRAGNGIRGNMLGNSLITQFNTSPALGHRSVHGVITALGGSNIGRVSNGILVSASVFTDRSGTPN